MMVTLIEVLVSGAALLVLYYWYRFDQVKSKISSIPSVGSDRFFFAYLDAWRFAFKGHTILKQGYLKYKGTGFKVPTLNSSSRWFIVVSGESMIEDMRKAPEDVLSFREAGSDLFGLSFGRHGRDDPFHISVVRSPLTRSLPSRFGEVRDEIVTACQEYVDPGNGKFAHEQLKELFLRLTYVEWKSLPALQTITHVVTRASNRLFVGLPLCRDPEYCKIQQEWAFHIMVAAYVLNITPFFLKPIVARFLYKTEALRYRVEQKFVGATIRERLEKFAQYGSSNYEGKQDDLISWLIDAAPPEHRNVEDITAKLMVVNLGAVHSTSVATTNTLFRLAVHQEYIGPLRAEIEGVMRAHGWTKESIGRLRKLDSFMKESNRLSGMVGLTVTRKAMKDFTFSNGVTVPAGYTVAVATGGIHTDPDIYEEPDKFKGFRFYENLETVADGSAEALRHQLVALDSTYLLFGHGRSACPGRFIAANEAKAILAHILLNYDIKLPDDSTKIPEGMWFGGSNLPDRSAHVLFRKRRLE